MQTLRTCIVSLCCVLIVVKADESCTTPDKTSGNCVDVRKCASIINKISTTNILNTADISYIRNFSCGFSPNGPKVCCPESNTAPGSRGLLPNAPDCGVFNEDRIIDETFVHRGSFPWLALLQYDADKGSSFRCGGVLINNRYVLTAAHCVQGDKYANWTLKGVRLGEHDVSKEIDCESEIIGFEFCSEPPIDVEVEKVVVHDKFDQSKPQHDVALIRLARSLTYTEYVNPICLEKIDTKLPLYFLVAVGWGANENGLLTDVKSRNWMKLSDSESCQSQYPEFASNSSQYICANIENNELPQFYSGDTGGSLEMPWELGAYYAVGIMWSRHPENSSGSILYTKVKENIPWILNNLEA